MWKYLTLAVLLCLSPVANAQQVTVLSGIESTLQFLEDQDWWGEVPPKRPVRVPPQLLTAISQNWQHNAHQLPVTTKKQIFYRMMLPLVCNANRMVLDRRAKLELIDDALEQGLPPRGQDLTLLREAAVRLRIRSSEQALEMNEPDEMRAVIAAALEKLDVIPPGLVLGQAAYESGYGTSRFTVEGNALFGQWSFDGSGIAPKEQREHLGNYRIAAFEWPFDSVRSYFLNLNSHRAYADFRRIRSELRQQGQALDSLLLADGLKNYSERGQAYIDELKSIIRVNKLNHYDDAALRDEPMGFVFAAGNEIVAAEVRDNIEAARQSGRMEEIIAAMGLD